MTMQMTPYLPYARMLVRAGGNCRLKPPSWITVSAATLFRPDLWRPCGAKRSGHGVKPGNICLIAVTRNVGHEHITNRH